MDKDGKFTLRDAQKVLRQALLLKPRQEEVLDYSKLEINDGIR